jgi:hypothetical protein
MSTIAAPPAETTPPPAATSPWEDRIAPFAKATGKTNDEITNALKALVGDPGPDAIAVLSDPTAVLDTDLQTVLVASDLKIPLGIFRKNVSKLRGPQVAPETLGEKNPSFDLLPSVPEDTSFLEMLKVGGVLKPAKTEVIAAIKAGLAFRLGVYDLPDVIIEKMEAFATEQDEPVGEVFFKLRKLVTTRNYGEVLSVLGVEGSFVSEGRKKTFLARLDEYMWAEVNSFYSQLTAWQDSWMATAGNPAMALSMLAMSNSGRGGVMPPGMMQPPETSAVRDAAEGVIDKINKVFAGVGIPVARALAFDATRIKNVLEEPTLPAMIGAANREQMLKTLGMTVGADYVRLERNLTRFVLAIMELPKVPSGNEEYTYLGAMLQLGASIPWDKLPGGPAARAGIGSRKERL